MVRSDTHFVIRFTLRRLAAGVVVLFFVSILIFVLIELLPGDAAIIASVGPPAESLTPEQLESVRQELGLTNPR